MSEEAQERRDMISALLLEQRNNRLEKSYCVAKATTPFPVMAVQPKKKSKRFKVL